jgi:hypothetical protein
METPCPPSGFCDVMLSVDKRKAAGLNKRTNFMNAGYELGRYQHSSHN